MSENTAGTSTSLLKSLSAKIRSLEADNGKQNSLTAGLGISITESNIIEVDPSDVDLGSRLAENEKLAGAMTSAAKQLFIDRWNLCWGDYGHYDPDKEKPFVGNKVEMTYEEAQEVMAFYPAASTEFYWESRPTVFAGSKIRTIFPIDIHRSGGETRLGHAFSGCEKLEVAIFNPNKKPGPYFCGAKDCNNMFWDCRNLRKVVGLWVTFYSNIYAMFACCRSLEELELFNLNNNLEIRESPLIRRSSLELIVRERYAKGRHVHDGDAETADITITVHADVYAKLTGDTTNAAAAALTAEELAAWQQLLTDAAEKKITFATTS